MTDKKVTDWSLPPLPKPGSLDPYGDLMFHAEQMQDYGLDSWNAAIEAAACEAEAHYIPGYSFAGPGFAQAGAKAIRGLKR